MTRRIPALWLAVAGVLVAPLLSAPLLAQSRGKEEAPISPAATAAVEKAAKAKAAETAPVPAAVPAASDLDNTWLLDLSTGGRVTIVLRPDVAPEHVARIKTLTREGFYNGTVFHRVIEGFMAQGGDPTGTGTGGSKLPNLKPEFSDLPHVRGAVSMARAQEKDSANSQFFIILLPTMKLDHNYTIFGRVTGGMEFVDKIAPGEPPADPSKIIQASMASDHKPPPAPQSTIPSAAKLGIPSLFETPQKPAAPPAAATPPKK
ncbi:peptidylprolyl isomerase [Polymorphobacter arshaanensis]|uniref:Peptidyl-prolyl cis-trans isomerase n=1 Tax=Glacieibacterium arshaanense TaxID=2511025 RepID=A0A4Y9EPJ3_9SPHN|nr:peptidylprolyl isomerase [Polymorphobacter arshaanensis]TFU05554.1 peptidylprolyl isomerase [Polymorphobacter arshaanensis]